MHGLASSAVEQAAQRLEQAGEAARLDKKAQGKTCGANIGITDEGAEMMKDYKGSPALDAGLIAAAQGVEHYEISRYGMGGGAGPQRCGLLAARNTRRGKSD